MGEEVGMLDGCVVGEVEGVDEGAVEGVVLGDDVGPEVGLVEVFSRSLFFLVGNFWLD